MKYREAGISHLNGVRIDAATRQGAAESVLNSARDQLGGVVCVANVDMVTRARRDPALAALMQSARHVFTDGMPLVWVLQRWLGQPWAQRVYGPDLMSDTCALCEQHGLSVFLLGGTPHELQMLKTAMASRWPRLQIAGAISPPQLPERPPRDPLVLREVQRSGAAVLLVGLGCPKQEHWMAAHAADLSCVCVGVGLAFAQIAGLKTRAPAWMQAHGLEWVFRLWQEPGRLWRRYLVGNARFVCDLAIHAVHTRGKGTASGKGRP